MLRLKFLFNLFTFLLASTPYIGPPRYKQSHVSLCIRAYFSILYSSQMNLVLMLV